MISSECTASRAAAPSRNTTHHSNDNKSAQATHDEQPPPSLEYPTGSTVPFPYDTPYPQQVALMDALLECLRLREEAEKKDEEEMNGAAAMGGSSISATSEGRSRKSKKRKASIIMLESPTGTGKSLSLACSAVAWLRYREQIDLMESHVVNSSSSTEANANSNTVVTPDASDCKAPSSSKTQSNGGHKTGISWIDSFVSPEERAEQDRLRLVEEGRQRAIQARHDLNQELRSIRRQLDRAATSDGDTKRGCSDAGARAVRENLARSAVTAATAAERKQRRRRGYNNKNKQGANGVGTVVKRSRDSSASDSKYSTAAVNDENTDFCLEEYNSDDNGASSSGLGDDDDSSDEEGGNYSMRLLDSLSKTPSGKLSSKHTQPEAPAKPPSELLAGGKLDGSNYDPTSKYRGEDSISSNSSHPQTTIGSVQPGSGVRKIVYAARTHSQLSQFVGELRRTAWGKDLRVVALGGRKLLCGNRDVLGPKHRSEKIITEKCLDLQKGKGKKTKSMPKPKVGDKRKSDGNSKSDDKSETISTGCPLMSSREAVSSLSVHLLARPSDIEDIGSLGKASNACAYYASRGSLTAAEVVVVPYNTLLSTQARAAVGLSLQNALVIVDEAHNIPEALRSLSSSRLNLPTIKAATEQLTAYTRKYAQRLAGRNLFYLGQIRRFLTMMTRYLNKKPLAIGPSSASSNSSKMMSSTELLFAMKLDNLNVFKILRYLDRSRLSQKLLGFMNYGKQAAEDEEVDEGDNPDFISKHVSPLSIVQTFLNCLTGSHREGKVVVEWPDESLSEDLRGRGALRDPTFRYVLLNPAAHFTDVLDEAYAVVLAGGTLRPFSHVAAELVTSSDANIISAASKAEAGATASTLSSISTISTDLTTFTCDHVVSSSHVHTARLAMGPTGTKLDFRHSARTSDDVCNELGRVLVNVAGTCPAGLVVFLPSYSYESHLMRRWGQTKVLDEIQKKKKVYREPKNSRDVERVLEKYSKDAVATDRGGAILFSVVGGKMSEGINFANDMARCVLVVGLPYPDITDPEMQEKMKSLDKEYKENGGNGITGQSYYHNLCMRAVNQSIGRAIRHAQDYAAVVLADARYSSDTRIWRALPKWLRGDDLFQQKEGFISAMGGLRTFFDERKSS